MTTDKMLRIKLTFFMNLCISKFWIYRSKFSFLRIMLKHFVSTKNDSDKIFSRVKEDSLNMLSLNVDNKSFQILRQDKALKRRVFMLFTITRFWLLTRNRNRIWKILLIGAWLDTLISKMKLTFNFFCALALFICQTI